MTGAQRNGRFASSFYHIVTYQQNDWRAAHLPSGVNRVLDNLANKQVANIFARRMGLPAPALHLMNATLGEVRAFIEGTSLDAFVVKPVKGKNSWAVAPLVRRPDGRFLNNLTGQELTAEGVVEYLAGEIRRHALAFTDRASGARVDDIWMIEDLVAGEEGPDAPVEVFRFYAMRGAIVTILHETVIPSPDGGSHRRLWYDADWNVVETGKDLKDRDPDLPLPKGFETLPELAVKASEAILGPFCRLDILASATGPVMGEFTFQPGRPQAFNAAFTERLTMHWHRACGRTEQWLAERRFGTLMRAYNDVADEVSRLRLIDMRQKRKAAHG